MHTVVFIFTTHLQFNLFRFIAEVESVTKLSSKRNLRAIIRYIVAKFGNSISRESRKLKRSTGEILVEGRIELAAEEDETLKRNELIQFSKQVHILTHSLAHLHTAAANGTSIETSCSIFHKRISCAAG